MKKWFLYIVLCWCFLGGAADISEKIAPFAQEESWKNRQNIPVLSRDMLVQSIEAGRNFYLNHQKPEGNFIYGLDLMDGEILVKDNEVRQAGALWGLSSLNRDRFNEPTRQAVMKGLDFFAKNVQKLQNGQSCSVYNQNEGNIKTGMVALYCLSLIEFLRGQEKYLKAEVLDRYRTQLDIHLKYLQAMELEDGSWARHYDIKGNYIEKAGSPYYDGEALLAYCKAARYLGYTQLKKRINDALPKLIEKYTVNSWNIKGKNCPTKGFYQWGCMAMAEYVEARWTPHASLATNSALALSWWLIYEDGLLSKQGNTGYSVEGLVGAYRIAKVAKDEASQKRLREVIVEVMTQLIMMQYKGPLMKYNPLLSSLQKVPSTCDGGITASLSNTFVRIDTHQHQMHAMLLALEHLF